MNTKFLSIIILSCLLVLLGNPVFAKRLPEIFTALDPITFNFSTGSLAFDTTVLREFSESPEIEIDVLDGQSSLIENIKSNLNFLQNQGVTWVDITVLEGDGLLWFNSPTLISLQHTDFNHNAQYQNNDPNGELNIAAENAKKKFVLAADVLTVIVTEAQQRGIKVTANIESLAHIINRASGSGIGGEASALVLADNLPVPNAQQFKTIITELLSLGVDAVFAEAFSAEYDLVLETMLTQANIPYWHSGAGVGNVWAGYYYSLYPAQPEDYLAYRYLHTDDGLIGLANIDFARARAVEKTTALVLGAYNPMPCDLDLNISDFYNPNRGNDLPWIDNNLPLLANGNQTENCTTALWRNLALFGVLSQDPDLLWLAADIEPSMQTTLDANFLPRFKQRLQNHAYRNKNLPVANIIVDLPNFDSAVDGYSVDDFISVLNLTVLPLIEDGLAAAGLQTVLTFGQPWLGGQVSLSYVVTAGGHEGTADSTTAPYWSRPQDLPIEIMALIDSNQNRAPVFIHPIFGVANVGQWQLLRSQFQLPQQFAYRNSEFSPYIEEQNSLISSFMVRSDGELIVDANDEPLQQTITAETMLFNSQPALLQPYIISDFGQTANVVAIDEVASERIVFSGNLLTNQVDDTGVLQNSQRLPSVFLLNDGQGHYLWTVNHLHHEAFTYMLTTAATQALAQDKTLLQSTRAHFRGGLQTLAFAYDQTELLWQMPVAIGTNIRLREYDQRGDLVADHYEVYNGRLQHTLAKRSLLVAEAQLQDAFFNGKNNYLYLPAVAIQDRFFEVGLALEQQAGTLVLQLQSFSEVQTTTNPSVFNTTTAVIDIPVIDIYLNNIAQQASAQLGSIGANQFGINQLGFQ